MNLLEIEKGLIGSLIMDNNQWDEIRELINSDDFENKQCAEIFNAIEKLYGKCDLIILGNALKSSENKDVTKLLLECMDIATPSLSMEYAGVIKENSKKRKAVEIGENLKTLAQGEVAIDDVVRNTEEQFVSFFGKVEKKFKSLRDVAYDYAARIQMLKDKKLEISGMATGYRKLDLITDGFKPGELIIIAARPSIGKTSMMACFTDYIGVVSKKNVAIFSIESPENEIFNKLVSIRAQISAKKLRIGDVNGYEHERMMQAIEDLGTANIFINDLSIINIMSIRALIKKLINNGNAPDIIFIDYLQIIEVDRGNETFATKITNITQGLKNIAKELKIPIVVAAQINRANGEESPRLMDLKDSGGIEAIADMVILLHREEFYKKMNCPEEKKGKIDVDVAKNRNGTTVFLEMNWVGEFTKVIE